MLKSLEISNYIIIDELRFEPGPQLNIITGETGAGKSIMLGALSLIIGERADTQVLLDKDKKCTIEAILQHNNPTWLKQICEDNEIEWVDDEMIVRRDISSAGKSRAFINDTPVNLAVLQSITPRLINLHRQFDHLQLSQDSFQQTALDTIAQTSALAKEFESNYLHYKDLLQVIQQHKTSLVKWQQEQDYKQFVLDEFDQLALQTDELEQLEQKLNWFQHQVDVQQNIAQSSALLGGEEGVLYLLKKVQLGVQGAAKYAPQYDNLVERLASVMEELKDILYELENTDEAEMDAEAFQRMGERFDQGMKMLKKHGCATTNELLQYRDQLATEVGSFEDLEQTIQQLEREANKQLEQLTADGVALHAKRLTVVTKFEQHVSEMLTMMGMVNAQFKVQLEETALNPWGTSRVEFLLDANKTNNFQPLNKAGSGGELSRLSLALEVLLSKETQMPTLVFDEVDTGISGDASIRVGELLAEMAQSCQVICITHQPQIASKGTRHYFVYKQDNEKGILTAHIKMLSIEERIKHIAQMSGGEQAGQEAIEYAKALLR